MQKVIFVCLLSLSMSLGAPSEQKGAPSLAPLAANVVSSNSVPKEVEATPIPHNDTSPAVHNASVVINNNKTATDAGKQQQNASSPAPTTKDGKQEAPKEEAKPKNETTQATVPTKLPETPSTQKIDASTEKAASTTPKANETTPKTAPTVKPADGEKPVQTRKFDGPSFIGGIIMTLGLIAISFMGYKYYKNQTERNYHTL